MEEFLNKLNITKKGTLADDGCYVIDLDNSNEYGRAYSRLDKSDLVYEDEDSSIVTYENSSIQYINDDYTITLLADFDADKYTLTCKEN